MAAVATMIGATSPDHNVLEFEPEPATADNDDAILIFSISNKNMSAQVLFNTGAICAALTNLTGVGPFTLTQAESGGIVTCNSANNIVVNLPAAQAGLNYKILIGPTSAGGVHSVTITAAVVSTIFGFSLGFNNGPTLFFAVGAGTTTCVMSANSAGVRGDFVLLNSDGTNWYAYCVSSGAGLDGTHTNITFV